MHDGSNLSHRHFRELVDKMFDGVYFIDRDRRITYWNPGAERITGYSADEVIGGRCRDNLLVHVDGDGHNLCAADKCPALQVMESGDPVEAEVFVHHRQGHRLPVQTRILPMHDEEGRVVGAMEIFRDISAVKAMAAQFAELKELALIDPLTGVGNRRHLEMHLQARLDEMERYGWRFGLLFCDIDSFKQVNDQHGHQVGDDVIRMVAKTLAACVRPFDYVGRWGGDEFMAIVTRVERWQLLAIAERLRALVEQSVINDGAERIGVTLSIGAVIVRTGEDARSVVERVDRLLYRSKSDRSNRVTIEHEAVGD